MDGEGREAEGSAERSEAGVEGVKGRVGGREGTKRASEEAGGEEAVEGL